MSKFTLLVGLVILSFANVAYAKGLTLFECEFKDGGSVVSVRDSNTVTVTLIDKDGVKDVVENPLNEAGVSTMIATDNTSVDSLDVLQGDAQYSLMYYHGKLLNDAKVLVFKNNEPDATYDCKMDTVKNNLTDPASIAGIFQP